MQFQMHMKTEKNYIYCFKKTFGEIYCFKLSVNCPSFSCSHFCIILPLYHFRIMHNWIGNCPKLDNWADIIANKNWITFCLRCTNKIMNNFNSFDNTCNIEYDWVRLEIFGVFFAYSLRQIVARQYMHINVLMNMHCQYAYTIGFHHNCGDISDGTHSILKDCEIYNVIYQMFCEITHLNKITFFPLNIIFDIISENLAELQNLRCLKKP